VAGRGRRRTWPRVLSAAGRGPRGTTGCGVSDCGSPWGASRSIEFIPLSFWYDAPLGRVPDMDVSGCKLLSRLGIARLKSRSATLPLHYCREAISCMRTDTSRTLAGWAAHVEGLSTLITQFRVIFVRRVADRTNQGTYTPTRSVVWAARTGSGQEEQDELCRPAFETV